MGTMIEACTELIIDAGELIYAIMGVTETL